MDYHADRFEDFSAFALVDGKPAAALPASIDRATGTVTSHAGLTFGGWVFRRDLRGSVALTIVDATLAALKAWGAIRLEVRIPPSFLASYPSADADYGLWRRGFSVVRRDLSSAMPLEQPLPINSSKRQAVARATKAGLDVRAGSLSQFHALLSDVLGWRHGAAPVHTLADLEQLSTAFPDDILLRTVEKEGEMVAGALVYRYPTAWHTQYLASSAEGRSLGALDLVIASTIDEARAAGAAWFSFGTSTTDQGRTLNDGLLWQKESFGGRAVTHDFMAGSL